MRNDVGTSGLARLVGMARWRCPDCGRQFGRQGQGHECSPAMTLSEYFQTGPPHERAICEAVLAHLGQFPDVHVEPVSVGILIKRTRVFCELRPMQRWEAVGFTLTRRLDHPRFARKVVGQGDRFHHVVNVAGPDEIDDLVKEWLTEAYLSFSP
jgi:hypothetical protein